MGNINVLWVAKLNKYDLINILISITIGLIVGNNVCIPSNDMYYAY